MNLTRGRPLQLFLIGALKFVQLTFQSLSLKFANFTAIH